MAGPGGRSITVSRHRPAARCSRCRPAALASVRELQLARTDSSRITAIANNVVNNSLQRRDDGGQGRLSSDDGPGRHRETIQALHQHTSRKQLQVSSTAKMSGSMPLCLLGLDPSAPQTVGLEMSAKLTAPGCLVQSNSKSPIGMQAKCNADHEGRHDLFFWRKGVDRAAPTFLRAPPPIVRSCRTPEAPAPRRPSAPATTPTRWSAVVSKLSRPAFIAVG